MLTEPRVPTLSRAIRPRSAGWRWAVGTLALATCVAFVATNVEPEQLSAALHEISQSPAIVVLAVAAYAAAFGLRASAWRKLFLQPPPMRELFSNLHTGLFLNHILPFKAGELARPALAVEHGSAAGDALASSIVARLLDFVCLSALALVFVPAAWEAGSVGLAVQAGAGLTLAVSLGLVLARNAVGTGKLGGRLSPVSHALRAIPARRLAWALPVVAASWVLEAGMVWAAGDVLGAELGLRVAIGATAVTILCQAVHITPGGIGIYEAAMTAVLVSFGIASDTAFEIALLTHGLKFAYAFAIGGAFGLAELRYALRSRPRAGTKSATRFEVLAARAWNVLNEGKPFTPVFSASVLVALAALGIARPDSIPGLAAGLLAVAPLTLLFWRFDFPLRLRTALWVSLAVLLAIGGAIPWMSLTVVLAMYLGFTVVLWGTVYYHLRIGTAWTNGFRFFRLVCENPDPTSGNLLEQLPKVAMLVTAFGFASQSPGAASSAIMLAFAAAVGLAALLVHSWFFRWVPALPQPSLRLTPPVITPRRSRRVIAIVIDGCRADRLLEASTPFLDRLRSEGADFRAMSTVYPARTVTCFSSMLTGASPEVHGMHSNFVPDLGVKCESVFDVLRAGGMRAELVGIAHLVDAFGPDDVRAVTAVMDNDEIDDALIAEGKRCLLENDPELLVLQLLSVDQTGHARGSYNAEYLAKIEETDRKIESFFAWCREAGFLDGATVMVTADHGQGIGIGGHGHMTPPEITIPCILWGEGVEPASRDTRPRFITDFAPTISGLLGVPAPARSIGRDLLRAEVPLAERPVVFVIPALNEARNLPSVLAAVERCGVENTRTIVVDDGSTDATAAVARALGATVVSHTQNLGLGAALRTGLAAARSLEPSAVVYLDADGEYHPAETLAMLAPIESGEADYVLGSRFAHGRPAGMARSRYFANRVLSAVVSFLALCRISDGQTGFRAFSPRAADIAEIVHDYNYAQVLTLDLVHKGMRLHEVPVSYRRRASGKSFISGQYLWRVPLGIAREMLHAW